MAAKEEKTESKGPKGDGFGRLAVLVFKYIFIFLLLPLVIASTVALREEILHFNATLQHDLWIGLVGYFMLYFFVYDLGFLYRLGQGATSFCFQFLKPLVNFAPYVIPVYTIVALIVFAVLSAIGLQGEWRGVFYSIMAATFAMHIILTAKDLYEKDSAPGKPSYFFGMGFVYIIDVFFIALVMNITLPGFSFVRFFLGLSETSFHIYKAIFTQLFL
ncbi:MAG: hypothetical protein HQL21_04135 [Candidatus Omnitrophica bacterium]|nr:hypothetical protein [Candidatus Omnitrophota bacterium]